MKKNIIVTLFLFICHLLSAQQDSIANNITISLITGAPGNDVYAYFGHTGIRVRNDSTGQDVLYSYGTFDFDTPNFYGKFIRGKLLYMLDADPSDRFFRYYNYYQRRVTEQILNLTNAEKEKLLTYINWNYQPANRYYLYDFFYDNCATVIRDVFEKELKIEYKIDSVRDVTFRQLLDEYVEKDVWTDFGIDLILGLPADKKADFRNQMFLPDYLSQNLAKATLNGKPLMQSTQVLVNATPAPPKRTTFTPMLVFIILALFSLIITFSKSQRVKNIFDYIIFFILGLGGFFLLFMWFGTDHIATRDNWNVLWMNPLCLFLAIGILMKKPKKWLRIVFAIYATILWLLLLTWGWFPQTFNMAVIPIIITMIMRSMDREGVVLNLILKKVTSHKPQATS